MHYCVLPYLDALTIFTQFCWFKATVDELIEVCFVHHFRTRHRFTSIGKLGKDIIFNLNCHKKKSWLDSVIAAKL